MAKIIAMIPARLDSQRVLKKNLRLLAGKPLVAHILDTAVRARVFDEVYLNSESDVFQEIAQHAGAKFYKRSAELASNAATNDDFAFDFMENVEGDIVVQLLATSPLISIEDIKGFVKAIRDGGLDTLVSVKTEQIECVHDGKPVNFEPMAKNPPSQTLKPVQVYSAGMMGWRAEKFKNNMKKSGCAYHGGDGKTGYYELKGYSTINIDREEDFQLAELAVRAVKDQVKSAVQYYEPGKEHVEADVPSILKKDGVINCDLHNGNKTVVHVPDLIKAMGTDTSWAKRLVNTENNSMTVIAQKPGEGNRLHYHRDWNEWWYIVQGEWDWRIGDKTVRVKKGDLVFIEKGKWHKITAAGNEMAIRMAVSREDVDHVYPEDEAAKAPAGAKKVKVA